MDNAFEHLSKDCVLPLVQDRIVELSAAITQLNQCLVKSPKERLRVSPHNGSFQYYLVTKESGERGIFIPKKKWAIARKISQRDYDLKMLQYLQMQLDALQSCAAAYNPAVAENCWQELHAARRRFVQPRYLSDDDFAEGWRPEVFRGLPFERDAAVLMTAQGERVRSKSEMIIANALYRWGIPYRYELPHKMSVGGCSASSAVAESRDGMSKNKKHLIKVYPDFTCLNKRTRQEFIWEHFGMVDDEAYAQKMVQKLESYQMNGYYPGVNLIMTMETHDRPLGSDTVERCLRRYLL